MKKTTKIITAVILSMFTLIICFCIGSNLKNKYDIEKHADESGKRMNNEQNTDTPWTTAVQHLIELPVQTDEQKLQTVANAINLLKSGQIVFKGEGDKSIDVSLSDCSVPLLAGEVLKSAGKYFNPDADDGSFGQSSKRQDATEADALDKLLPYGKQCEFLPDGVKEVTSEAKGNWIYYKITLAKEYTQYPDAPPTHAAAIGQLDFSDNPDVKWIDYIRYGETQIEAVIDTANNNTLVSYDVTMPIELVDIYGKVWGIYGTADINANLSYHWDFTY